MEPIRGGFDVDLRIVTHEPWEDVALEAELPRFHVFDRVNSACD